MKSSVYSGSGWAFLRVAWATLTLGGCSSEATQLVVVIDSDYGAVLSEVRVEVSHDDGPLGAKRFETARFALPLSFGVLPPGDDPSRSVTMVARAVDSGARELSSRRAVTGFIEDKTLLLPIFLARSCRTRSCSAERTCTEAGCRSPNIDPSQLTEVEPGREVEYPFPSPPDAGPPVRVQTGVVQTAGGASLMSPTHRMTVYVGAPQPLGERVSKTHRLRLEALHLEAK